MEKLYQYKETSPGMLEFVPLLARVSVNFDQRNWEVFFKWAIPSLFFFIFVFSISLYNW